MKYKIKVSIQKYLHAFSFFMADCLSPNPINLQDISSTEKIWNKRAQRALGRSPEEKVKGQGEAIIL